MERHDPLATGDSPADEIPVAKMADCKVRTRKPKGLLHELAEVKDDTLAFLYAGADQQPGDYERSLDNVARIRHDFTAYCQGNPHFPNWRVCVDLVPGHTNRGPARHATHPNHSHPHGATAITDACNPGLASAVAPPIYLCPIASNSITSSSSRSPSPSTSLNGRTLLAGQGHAASASANLNHENH